MKTVISEEEFSFKKLTRDIRNASRTMSDKEARFLVDAYYIMQEDRKRSFNQVRSMDEEPHEVLEWLADNSQRLENGIKSALDAYSMSKKPGEWMRSITGIGPVIAAGMLAHIDIEKCPTVGHIWNFAGLNPDIKWNKGERRPFSADFKTLCAYKLGESFVKVQNNKNDFYGSLFRERKAKEWEKNLNGEYSDQASGKLEKFNIGKDTDAYKWYSGAYLPKYDWTSPDVKPKKAESPEIGCPMLPPAHIHARARRYTIKIFLSHLHHVMYWYQFGELPPKPYVIEHMGHVHIIEIPNFQFQHNKQLYPNKKQDIG